MRTWRDLRVLLVIVPLVALAYLLPPDGSWAQVASSGVLRACVPDQYPPLVTGEDDPPGIDVEILRTIADRLGLRLQLVTNPAIGRDFNPRNWRVTRAQCQVLAGGVVDSVATRSFLETTRPYLETGWAMVGPSEVPSVTGERVAVLVRSTGLDRIALSRFLREQRAEPILVDGSDQLVEAVAEGRAAVGVTEALTARALATRKGWTVRWLPVPAQRHGVALGLWKGDVTLKRHIDGVLRRMKDSGALGAIFGRYDLAPITDRVP